MQIIDFRSDTVTKPSAAMLQAMIDAQVGDDVFAEDPTVRALEEKVAALFGMQAGLFFPSGTMSNQVAIKAHTQALDEVICDKLSHIYNYETGAWAMISGVSVRLTNGLNGKMDTSDIESCMLPDFDWYPNTRMVAIENSINKGGGSIYSIAEMKAISAYCKGHQLILHCDGARIFNALCALNATPFELSGLFDSMSVCLSKGLGAPVGSVLIGNNDFIKKARKIRKALGGGMRQAGLLAAAGMYALDNNVMRLGEDHLHARQIEAALKQCAMVKSVLPVHTNIVIAEVDDAVLFAEKLVKYQIKVQPFSATQVRFVTHLDVSSQMVEMVCKLLMSLE
jgi:threonine aldolase